MIATYINIWAGLCSLAAIGLVIAAPRIGRLRAAAWMITVAALLLVEEDPALLIFMASAGPTVDRDGVLGIVHAHTRAHMYGGAAWTVGAMFISVLMAHGWLVRRDWLAWTGLLGLLVIGGAGDLYALTVYPHGLSVLPAPADGVRGFGWSTLVAGIVIWGFALAYSIPALTARRRSRSTKQTVPAHA